MKLLVICLGSSCRFLACGGKITIKVMGHRGHWKAVCRGMEILCRLEFSIFSQVKIKWLHGRSLRGRLANKRPEVINSFFRSHNSLKSNDHQQHYCVCTVTGIFVVFGSILPKSLPFACYHAKQCSYRINKINSNEILVRRASHNNFVGDFSMHREKFWKKLASSFKFQSISILVIFDSIQDFLVSMQYYSLYQQN